MRVRSIAVLLGTTFTATLVLSATAGIVATPESRDILTINKGRVVAGPADGNKRPLLRSSQLLSKNRVRELLDWKTLKGRNLQRLLLTVGESQQRDPHAPGSDALWQVDSDGTERFVSADVFKAKLSPDGEQLLFATFSGDVGVQKSDGTVLLRVVRGHDPSWNPDGGSIVLARTEEGSNPDTPETLRICTIDIATAGLRSLTDVMFDDVRPEFHPSGRWVIFVSGGRTGFASFWRVSADGGAPIQLTNIGTTTVDDRFVPTPFKRTIWSSDGRWFLYDFKSGDREEVWGLEFDSNGDFIRALKISAGLNPQWVDNGAAVAVQRLVGGEPKAAIVELPQ